jgi:transcriptional regulator with XRE-family HTH domain
MSLPSIHRYIGRIIHLMRREKGMRQSELALLTGLKQPNLSRIENGLVSPRPPTLEKIARALGVEVQVFYSESKVQEVERKWAASMGPKHAALLYAGDLITLPLLEISETQALQIDAAGVILHAPQQLNLQLPSDPALTDGGPFAIRIESDAMRQPGSPEDFRPGELAIFTSAAAKSGDFAFTALNGANLFRRVVFDGSDHVRLIPLNATFPERTVMRSEIQHMWRLAKHIRGY